MLKGLVATRVHGSISISIKIVDRRHAELLNPVDSEGGMTRKRVSC
jgi:hypothetical protein